MQDYSKLILLSYTDILKIFLIIAEAEIFIKARYKCVILLLVPNKEP